MTRYQNIISTGLTLLIAACQSVPQSINVQNQQIKDRVIACSGGFSQSTQLGLLGLIDLANTPLASSKGQLSLDYKQQAQGLIFQEMDSKDNCSMSSV